MNGAGSRNEPSQRAPTLMWRRDGFKLILHLARSSGDALMRLDDMTGELYDLTADPNEWDNRYDDDSLRDRRETMTRELLFHLACVHATYPQHQSQLGTQVNEPEAVGNVSPTSGMRYWY